ncbi:TonB-dependent receptor plug domain-containing protein [Nitrospira lenta]|uniref:Putative Vitamin B12 transporter BtuB n=1 Tax=Nitrospira lenta TaxID=1436998 RepID=A0A330LB39_9BACT|nr:TonB-dependent receptor [Nitrospira lenta]SPP66480.1 putative Vitamin B12 transporter BtuB [Nitrospira lenta]
MSLFVLRWVLCACVLSVCQPLQAALAQDAAPAVQSQESAPADQAQGVAPAAQTKDVTPAEQADIIQTPEVFVSATKTPIPVTQVTSATEVITEQDLKRRQIKTVADALRLSQGLTVFSNGGPGTSTSVRIRGSNSDQVLVLIDGAIMNSATLGEFNLANLTTDNIERIEILRGAQSMLWGADAMGGVINITTKRGTGAPSANAFFEYGSFSSIREGGQVSGKTGIVDYSVALSRWDYTGFSAVNYRRGATERDGFHNWQASTRLGIALPHEGRLDFNFRLLQGKASFDNGFGPGFDTLGGFSNSQQFVYSAAYTQPITNWWNQVFTAARQTEDLESSSGQSQRNVQTGVVSTPFLFRSQINTVSNRLEWQNNFQIGKPLLLTAGYQFREQQGENRDLLTNSLDIPTKTLSSHAGFAQAQLNLWDRVFATAGVRHDEYNVFGGATTYRTTAGYLHQETGTKLRGSYATGFRAPTINQLYFPFYGNANLKPERSQSMDVGVDQYLLDKRLTISGGYFWNRFRDMIVTQASSTVCSPFGFCAENAGLVGTKGWEASVKYAVIRDVPLIKSLDVQAQYTNTISRNLQQYPGNRSPRMPVDQWSLIVSYQPIDPLRINLEGRYVGSRFNDVNSTEKMRAFDVWNLSATYDVMKQVQAYVRADNIFNEKYEEVLYYGTPIRSIFAGVRVNYDAK